MSIRPWRFPIGFFAASIVLVAAKADEPASAPEATPTTPVLRLANGGFVPGELIDSPDPKILRWRSPAFGTPFAFATGRIDLINWPPPERLPQPTGDLGFELSGGGLVFGKLIALDEHVAELDVSRFGRLHVDRTSVQRIFRLRDDADLIYSGPNGLSGWREPVPKGSWREEAGQPLTDRDGATLHGALGLPEQAVVEFEISWKTRADFVLALGVGDDEKSRRRAFRFEVWDGDLVVSRETESVADVASVGKVAAGPGRVHLLAYLDQPRGRILVVAPNGKTLADLTVADPSPRVFGDVALTNVRGDVRLERLRIGRWDGSTPREVDARRSRIQRVDGSTIYGEVVRFDAETHAFMIRGESGESRLARDQITDVFLSIPGDEPPRLLRATYVDGTRLSGSLRKVEGGFLDLEVPGLRETPRLPLEGLRSLVVLTPEAAESTKRSQSGLLELEGIRLPGHLVESREAAGPLVWQPDGSGTASPILPGTSGRIVLNWDPTPPTPAPTASSRTTPSGMGLIALKNGLQMFAAMAPKVQEAQRRALHLRTGDVIPCQVETIDEEGVRFKSDLSPNTFVPHEKVKAIELAALAPDAIKVGKAKRERLLTLPRMRKESPPTQLIRSINGDYLRGSVVSMDETRLQIEVRLEEKLVPRDRIARIIWFHADELDAPKAPVTPPEADSGLRIQAVRSDGVRLTFRPESFAGETLSGTSGVLGACQVRLADVDQLLIGGAIEREAARLTYGRWTLHHAPEPKFAEADQSGTASPLVGKAAPDFELELLDGKKFHLAAKKGQIVVLDFWATWCGPCLQAMPQVDRIATEFRDRDVQVISVNLQEAPPDIKAMLARHKLHPTVALDVDGVVADRYDAAAIPQTVVIDREGLVARLFVGGGTGLEDQLRDALKTLTSPDATAPPGP